MSIRLKLVTKKLEREYNIDNDAFRWCEELFLELQKRKRDKDFTNDLISSAVLFFEENFTEQQKSDCFLYVLGKAVRK